MANEMSDLEIAARAALEKEMQRVPNMSRSEQLTFLLGFSEGTGYGFERAQSCVLGAPNK